MPWVASHSDLMLSGLSPSACRPSARAIDSIDLVTGRFQIDGHGFDGGDTVRFATAGAPSPLTALPSGLVAGRWYAVAPTGGDPDFFTLSPLLIPTDAGAGEIFVSENYIAKIDRHMANWTSVLVAKAVAYKPPWTTAPPWAPMMVAKLAAPTVAQVLRVSTDRYDVAQLAEGYAWAIKELAFLEAGGIYNDGTGPIDAAASTGTAATMRATGRRPVGWGARCL